MNGKKDDAKLEGAQEYEAELGRQQQREVEIREAELRGYKTGVEEGRATQAMLEIRGRDKFIAEIKEKHKAEMDAVYRERNMVVAALASLTLKDGRLPRIEKDKKEAGWYIVFIWLAEVGQLSWHIKEEELGWFTEAGFMHDESLPTIWDGHTTEEKYRRLLAYCGVRG